MIKIRKSKERGSSDLGWLKSKFSFSFAGYYDPSNKGFRQLRVINEDRISPGKGFDFHPHQDMEIVSYIIEGALEHKDSMGNVGQIVPGQIQRMSAGTGVIHSEYNPSKENETHMLQIWVHTDKKGHEPSYETIAYKELKGKNLKLIVSPNGENGSATIHQDVKFYSGKMANGESEEVNLRPGRYAWIQLIQGTLHVNKVELNEGDGAISEEELLKIESQGDSEFLLIDLN
jgi:redox-sensitive bicupin YhaK (pirin superfamily)